MRTAAICIYRSHAAAPKLGYFSINATASVARWAWARCDPCRWRLARELAAQAREQLARGVDPIDARKAAALEQRAARAKLTTFKQNAEEYYEANATRWSNQKHRTNGSTLFRALCASRSSATCRPWRHRQQFGSQGAVAAGADKPVTAARLRGRIEAVLDFCRRRPDGEPATTRLDKEMIAHLLPLRSERRRQASARAAVRQGARAHGGCCGLRPARTRGCSKRSSSRPCATTPCGRRGSMSLILRPLVGLSRKIA